MFLHLEPREQEERNESDRDELHTADRLNLLARPGHQAWEYHSRGASLDQFAQTSQQVEYARADPGHTQQPEPGTDEEPRAGTPQPSFSTPSVAGETFEK